MGASLAVNSLSRTSVQEQYYKADEQKEDSFVSTASSVGPVAAAKVSPRLPLNRSRDVEVQFLDWIIANVEDISDLENTYRSFCSWVENPKHLEPIFDAIIEKIKTKIELRRSQFNSEPINSHAFKSIISKTAEELKRGITRFPKLITIPSHLVISPEKWTEDQRLRQTIDSIFKNSQFSDRMSMEHYIQGRYSDAPNRQLLDDYLRVMPLRESEQLKELGKDFNRWCQEFTDAIDQVALNDLFDDEDWDAEAMKYLEGNKEEVERSLHCREALSDIVDQIEDELELKC